MQNVEKTGLVTLWIVIHNSTIHVFRHEESWPSKMEGPLLRKIAALRRALYLAGKERKEAENGVKILMQVCASTSSHPC